MNDFQQINEPFMTPEGFVNPACMNELEGAIKSMGKTHDRMSHNDEWNKKIWVFDTEIAGAFAKWAVRQSPYGCPDNLEKVVKYLLACVRSEFKKFSKEHLVTDGNKCMAYTTLCDISKMLYDILYEQNVKDFDAWNQCKKGKTPDVLFSSAYDTIDPDYDFIDLDALLHNVCLEIRDEQRKDEQFDRKFKEEYGSLPWENMEKS